MRWLALLIALAAGLLPGPHLYADTLQDELDAAFGPNERREVLARACLATAGKITGDPPRVIRHRLRRLPNDDTAAARDLCEKMSALYRENTDARSTSAEADEARVALSRDCGALLRGRLANEPPSAIASLQRMRAICAEMTGTPPPIRIP